MTSEMSIYVGRKTKVLGSFVLILIIEIIIIIIIIIIIPFFSRYAGTFSLLSRGDVR
jgi:hypothetical protein